MVTEPISTKRFWLTPYARHPTSGSLFFPNGNVIRVGDRDKVQQSRDDHEFRAIVRRGKRDRALAPVVGQCQDIKSARPKVSDEAENVEDVAAVRLINSPLHREAEQKHR